MPEGHLVHRHARELADLFSGRQLRVTSPQGRFRHGAAAVDGHVLEGTEAYGKHLFLAFDEDAGSRIVHVHLGRLGTWLWLPADTQPRASVRMRLASDTRAADLIAPIVCELGEPDLRDTVVDDLGPDPLRADAEPAAAIGSSARSGRPIGALLLDQSVISGIGNVLRAEILNIVGVHPQIPGRDLTDAQRDLIWTTTADVMRAAVDIGRILTRRPPGADVETLDEVEGRFVYARDRCGRCDSLLEHLEVGGRAINACPTCQPRT
jgi:endonuclease-8